MDNNKKFLIVFSVVLLLDASLVVAEDTNDIGTQDVNQTNFTVDYEGYRNETHNFTKSDNISLQGFCLDSQKDRPSLASNYTISTNSSSVDNRTKELIAKYFRYNNSDFDNRRIKEAI